MDLPVDGRRRQRHLFGSFKWTLRALGRMSPMTVTSRFLEHPQGEWPSLVLSFGNGGIYAQRVDESDEAEGYMQMELEEAVFELPGIGSFGLVFAAQGGLKLNGYGTLHKCLREFYKVFILDVSELDGFFVVPDIQNS